MAAAVALGAFAANANAVELVLVQHAAGFTEPIDIQNAGDGSGRLFVVQQNGRIRIINSDASVEGTDFLNLSTTGLNRVFNSGERGLLGLAFHPDYENNGEFFVHYSELVTGDTIIARYTVSANPNIANTTEEIILEVDQPQGNHNGGTIAFGPDGYFYILLGDGGNADDVGGGHAPEGNGQNLMTMLGKVLRIDVDNPEAPNNYGIPGDNFFEADGDSNTLGEIYAYGLRNPFRGSFDRGTGRLFLGDVGQNRREEVDIIVNGGNYGWRIMEGIECFNVNDHFTPLPMCDMDGLILPINDYGRSIGTTVTGGYVYRGSMYPNMVGLYIFGDFGSGRIWSLEEGPPGTWTRTELEDIAGGTIAGFGEDEAGELYMANRASGQIMRLTDISPTPTPTPEPSGVKDSSVFQ